MADRWFRLPDPDSPEARGWPLALAREAAPDDAVPLAFSLADLLVRAEEQRAPGRVRFVLLDDPPVEVRAWALADLEDRAVADADEAALAAAREAAAPDPGRLWARDVRLGAFDGDPVVLVHDLPVLPDGALDHRVVLLRFPRDAARAVRLVVSTTRLAAVPDLVDVALTLARSIDPTPRGAAR